MQLTDASVKHILTECYSYEHAWQQYYVHTNLKYMLSHSTIKSILEFVKNDNKYDKL